MLSNTLRMPHCITLTATGLLKAPSIFIAFYYATVSVVPFLRSLFSSRCWLPAIAVYVASIGLLIFDDFCISLIIIIETALGVSSVQLWWVPHKWSTTYPEIIIRYDEECSMDNHGYVLLCFRKNMKYVQFIWLDRGHRLFGDLTLLSWHPAKKVAYEAWWPGGYGRPKRQGRLSRWICDMVGSLFAGSLGQGNLQQKWPTTTSCCWHIIKFWWPRSLPEYVPSTVVTGLRCTYCVGSFWRVVKSLGHLSCQHGKPRFFFQKFPLLFH